MNWTIASAVEKMTTEGPDGETPTAVTYSLQSATPSTAMAVLRGAVPGALFTSGADPRELIAWARPSEHEKIKGIVDQMVSEARRTAVTYTLEADSPATALSVLRAAAPQAQFTTGAEPHQVIVWARPDDHKVIADIVAQMAAEGPDEAASKVAVYSLKSMTATDAITALTPAVPNVRFSQGADPRRLIAWARPSDHAVIEEIVGKMVEKGPAELAPKVVIYTLEETDASSAMRFLEAAVPEAEAVAAASVHPP